MTTSRKTARQAWDEAEEGTSFAVMFVPDYSSTLDETAEVIWTKGSLSPRGVDTLAWEDVIWISPVEYGEVFYR